MIISNDCSSLGYNTFGIDVNVPTLIEISNKQDLSSIVRKFSESKCHVLGGGSNILLTKDLEAPLLYINTKGVELIKEADDYVLVKVEAGESWHEIVLWAISQNYGGIENLSLIPGKCGAAPMQNIGAYGVEIKDILHAVSAYKLSDGHEYTFHNEECGFGYRTSNFKTIWKDQFIISDIILRLTKEGHHELNTSYGAISSELEKLGITNPSIQDISDVVIEIRKSKLPYPEEVGNAGSFFKNPIISKSQYDTLIAKYPNMPSYPVDAQHVKVPAGWLIDQCGWKGKVVGQTGTYKNQALVLVNHGSASGEEIYDLSTDIKDSVKQTYNITLEREVNVW